jgi:uncharacterized protein
MADFDNRAIRGQATAADLYDSGLRSYMLRVYNYMLIAMLVTGVAAYGIYSASVTHNPAEAALPLHGGLALTKLGVAIFASPLRWVIMLAPIGVALFLQVRLRVMSVVSAQLMFWAFSALMGFSIAAICLVYAATDITQAFFITAAAFGGLSLFGYTTKRDLSGIASFLIMGMWGLFFALIANIFFQSSQMQTILSVIGVGIFAGLTAYDSQAIKERYSANDDGTVTGRKAILGAVHLYIDFINMFQFVLQLLAGGSRR